MNKSNYKRENWRKILLMSRRTGSRLHLSGTGNLLKRIQKKAFIQSYMVILIWCATDIHCFLVPRRPTLRLSIYLVLSSMPTGSLLLFLMGTYPVFVYLFCLNEWDSDRVLTLRVPRVEYSTQVQGFIVLLTRVGVYVYLAVFPNFGDITFF